MLKVTPLDAPFGVEITGADISAGVGDDALRVIVDALHQNRFAVIRGQTLDLDAYLKFGEQWGRPHPHVLDHLRMPGYPGIMAIGNTQEKDRDPDIRNGAVFWHSDQSYEAEPASVTMLYSVKAPAAGGETLIADLAAAYDALPLDMKARLDGLKALHLYGAAAGADGENIAAPIINDEQADQVPPVPHLIARPHPVTGRVSLYAVAGTPYAVAGMADVEARSLLAELKAHALQDRFVYKHKYRVGDIALWDNAATLHSGTFIDFAEREDQARLLYRISVKGKPRIFH